MKPSFGGKFSYSDQVTLYLEGLVSVIEREAESAAKRQWMGSVEFRETMQKEVQIALDRLSVHLKPRLLVSDEPVGMQIVISAWDKNGGEDVERTFSLEKLLTPVEDEDEASYDAYIEEMYRFVEARRRKLKHRGER